MAVKSASRPLTRRSRATPTTVARPHTICHFAGDGPILTLTQLQQQHLVGVFNLPPTLAADVAELVFGGAK